MGKGSIGTLNVIAIRVQFKSGSDGRAAIFHAILEYGLEGVRLSSASPTISDSVFRNFFDMGIITFGDSSPTIMGNTFSDNVKGVQMQATSSAIIENNQFLRNTGDGTLFFGTVSAQVKGNTFSEAETGVSCWENSTPAISGNTFSNNAKGIVCSDDTQPTVSGNVFNANTESGASFFGNSSPVVSDNRFTGNLNKGVECWANSTPLITSNLITGNKCGVLCGNSARPTIIGNSFDANVEIGLVVSDQVGLQNPVIVGNSFINHSFPGSNWGIYAFNSSINAPHN